MISIPYFKHIARSNLKFLCACTFVLCLFLIVMTNVFTPTITIDTQSALHGTILQHIFTGNGTLIGFMANSFYALMAVLFPMVYAIIVGNKLIAEQIDKGYMAGFLATLTTRLQIVFTSAVYFVLSFVFMWGVVSVVGIISANIFQPDALDIPTFLTLNCGIFLYHAVISGICFCSSCIYNTTKNALVFGAGIPLYFFVMSLIIKLSDRLDVLKYFTLNTLYDTHRILEGSGYTESYIIMFILSFCLYAIGIVWFQKKDLPL